MGCCFTTICRSSSTTENVEPFPSGYAEIRLLHEGNSRKIYRCQYNATDLCCKIIPSRSLSSRNELVALKFLKEKKLAGPLLSHYYLNSDYTQIFYHYIQGCDLFDLGKKMGAVPEPIIKKIALNLLKILRSYHKNNLWHLDLKPENVICEEFNLDNLRIIDFGQARIIDDAKYYYKCKNRGTQGYAAPEIYNNYCCAKSDIWSLAALLYVLIFREYPLPHSNKARINSNYCKRKYWKPKLITMSEEGQDFFLSALELNPKIRASAVDLIAHPWLYS